MVERIYNAMGAVYNLEPWEFIVAEEDLGVSVEEIRSFNIFSARGVSLVVFTEEISGVENVFRDVGLEVFDSRRN